MATEETIHTNISADVRRGETFVRDKYKTFYQTTLTFVRYHKWTVFLDKLLSGIEGLFLRSSRTKPIDRPIFILGNFRSGTSLLENLILADRDVGSFSYFSQVFPNSPFSIRLLAKWLPFIDPPMNIPHQPNMVVSGKDAFEGEIFWKQCKNNYWSEHKTYILGSEYDDPAFETYFKQAINKHLAAQHKSRFINKNPWNTLRIGYLLKMFPDAKLVYIVRNPDKVVRSQCDMEEIFRVLFKELPGCNELYADQFFPPKIYFRTDRYAQIVETDKSNKMLATARSIDDMDENFHLEYEKIKHQTRLFSLKFEDLLSDFVPQMSALLQFLELEVDQEKLQRLNGEMLDKSLISHKKKQNPVDEDIASATRNMKHRHGYS